MENKYKIIIIGGGPAGISAGIYVRRAGESVLVLDDNDGALKNAKTIQNYYGIENISGKELKEKGIEQFKKLGGTYKNEQVVKIQKDYSTENIIIETNNNQYICKALILCLGAGKEKTILNLNEFENTNVSYCAICDAFFYQEKEVCVIGDSELAKNEYNILKKVAKKVYLLTNGTKIEDKNYNIITDKIKTFIGKNKVEQVLFENKKTLNVDGVFVALGKLSNIEISKQLGVLTQNNNIVVDNHFQTNVAGVFAAGDAIGGLLQVVKATSDGACSAIEALKYITINE